MMIQEGLPKELTFRHKFVGSEIMREVIPKEIAYQSEKVVSPKTLAGTHVVYLRNT